MMYKLLLVCTGNICRSPTAEGVLRHRVKMEGLEKSIVIDSAGTHGYHIGEAPDPRSIAAAARRGIDIENLRARKITADDFHTFNVILGLDREHVGLLRKMAPDKAPAHIDLFMEYAGERGDVPDPYYGGSEHFEHVLDLVESAAPRLIEKLKMEM